MIVTFCGHRTVIKGKEVEQWLDGVTDELIARGENVFYLGGYGEFDRLCSTVLMRKRKFHPQIELQLILPYLNHNLNIDGYDATIYPELERTPPRFAIIKRNQWMVEQSTVVVAYVTSESGGAYQTLIHARHKKKEIFLYVHDHER